VGWKVLLDLPDRKAFKEMLVQQVLPV